MRRIVIASSLEYSWTLLLLHLLVVIANWCASCDAALCFTCFEGFDPLPRSSAAHIQRRSIDTNNTQQLQRAAAGKAPCARSLAVAVDCGSKRICSELSWPIAGRDGEQRRGFMRACAEKPSSIASSSKTLPLRCSKERREIAEWRASAGRPLLKSQAEKARVKLQFLRQDREYAREALDRPQSRRLESSENAAELCYCDGDLCNAGGYDCRTTPLQLYISNWPSWTSLLFDGQVFHGRCWHGDPAAFAELSMPFLEGPIKSSSGRDASSTLSATFNISQASNLCALQAHQLILVCRVSFSNGCTKVESLSLKMPTGTMEEFRERRACPERVAEEDLGLAAVGSVPSRGGVKISGISPILPLTLFTVLLSIRLA